MLFDEVSAKLNQVDSMVEKARQLETETFEMTQFLDNEDKKVEAHLQEFAKLRDAGVPAKFESFVNRAKSLASSNRNKADEIEGQMGDIDRELAAKEQALQAAVEQFEEIKDPTQLMDGLDAQTKELLRQQMENLDTPIESKVRDQLDHESEVEEENLLNRVMADLEEFKTQSERQIEATEVDPMRAVNLIEEILQEQTRFNEHVDRTLAAEGVNPDEPLTEEEKLAVAAIMAEDSLPAVAEQEEEGAEDAPNYGEDEEESKE